MSNVVQFLESLACSSKTLTAEEFVKAVTNADLTTTARLALLERDIEALSRELGGRNRMICLVYPADNEEQPAEEAPNDDDEKPNEEPTSKAA
jgi:hypothetical protein